MSYLSKLKLALANLDAEQEQAKAKPIAKQTAAAEAAWWAGLEPDEPEAVIEYGDWHTGEPPEAPPPLDDGPTAEYWGWPPLPPAKPDTYQPGECRPFQFCGPVVHPAPVSQEQAMGKLERFLAAVKLRRAADDDSDESTAADWREAERDRHTLYAGGLGALPGTGAGGFKVGWEPAKIAEQPETV